MTEELLENLAILSAAPAFPAPLYVGRPNLGNRERLLERINEMLDRNWLTNNGPFVRELEQRIAEAVGVKHCIPMCNGTVALEIAIRALGFTGEVIIPSMTFIATAHALQWQEITPVFCDIDPTTHTLDPQCVEQLITPRTTGIIGVHLWGRPCNVEALAEIAERRGLTLMFDAAHAFGCSHKGQMIGRFGTAEVFSFHATKFFNSFEGGAVVTNDEELAAKIRLMKNFGFTGQDSVSYIGTNGKMPEIAAAMGLTSLESLDEFRAVNWRNYQGYRTHLEGIPGLHLMQYDENEQGNYQYIVLQVDETVAELTRDQLMEVLHAENVLARRYFYPGCHRMEPYRSLFPNAHLWLPNTEEVASRVLVLPTGTQIDEQGVSTICGIIRTALSHADEVVRRLARFRAKGLRQPASSHKKIPR